jgi:hypothetical protein
MSGLWWSGRQCQFHNSRDANPAAIHSCKWELSATLPRSQLLIPSWSQAQEKERGLDERLTSPLC